MGTMTITTTAPQDVRLIAAYTDLLQPFDIVDGAEVPRDATAGEIKAHIIQSIRGAVHTFETREANEAASAAIVPIEPT